MSDQIRWYRYIRLTAPRIRRGPAWRMAGNQVRLHYPAPKR
jgi:hypothetical protein